MTAARKPFCIVDGDVLPGPVDTTLGGTRTIVAALTGEADLIE